MSDKENLVHKPWGFYEDFFRSRECTFKQLIIREGQSISYQKHEKRSEFWYVALGNPVLKLSVSPKEDALTEFSQSILREKESVEIPVGMWHQLTAPVGCGDVVIYEMQFGDCSEDDIERLDDPYNRD